MRRIFIVAAALVGLAGMGAPALAAPARTVDADPILCWWRTSTNAVRIGQTFSLVITCGILDNDAVTVAVDRSQFDVSALQVAPFEVLTVTHPDDLVSGPRRFFQYAYTLRTLDGALAGKDARIAPLSVTYRIQSHVESHASVEGRAQMYILPAEPLRILSLVPADAADIRDTPAETSFAAVDAHALRAKVLQMLAAFLTVLGAALVLLAIVRFATRLRKRVPAAAALAPDRTVLRTVARELAAVRRARERDGWSDDAAGRALAACRIAAGYAVASPVSQAVANGRVAAVDGELLLGCGLARRKKTFVSGSLTADAVGRARAGVNGAAMVGHDDIGELQSALSRFTAARYGREARLDEVPLDESLAAGERIVRRLRVRHLWIVKTARRAMRAATGVRDRVWPR